MKIICDESRIQDAVRKSLDAYRAHEARLPLSRFEFLLQQAQYIRKRWWLMQAAVLALLWSILLAVGSVDRARRCMGVLVPLFGALMLPELWRNRSGGAMEIECAARHSLRQIYAARMLLFGMVDLTLISLFFAAASLGARMPLRELLLQFLVPLNVTCCICFRTLYARRIATENTALLLCLIWAALWGGVVLDQAIYAAVSVPAWVALAALSALYLARCATEIWRRCEENWEVNPEWN